MAGHRALRLAELVGAHSPITVADRIGPRILVVFAALGLGLGILARLWMRVISTAAEFTWPGTLGLLVFFTVFALTQSLAALAVAKQTRVWVRRVARCAGAVSILPLFAAAGAVMAPALVCGAAALWHPRWPRLVRGGLLVIALVDVAAVSASVVVPLGVSARSVAGVVGLLMIYACLIWAAGATFSPPRRHAVTQP